MNSVMTQKALKSLPVTVGNLLALTQLFDIFFFFLFSFFFIDNFQTSNGIRDISFNALTEIPTSIGALTSLSGLFAIFFSFSKHHFLISHSYFLETCQITNSPQSQKNYSIVLICNICMILNTFPLFILYIKNYSTKFSQTTP